MSSIAVGLGVLLGLGIISKKFKAGLGLGEAGVGISQLATGIVDIGVAPFRAFGTGLGEFSVGVKTFSETLGDLGRGIAALFGSIPPGWQPDLPSLNGNGLITNGGHRCSICGASFRTHGELLTHVSRAHSGY